jgi:hypothetical protein
LAKANQIIANIKDLQFVLVGKADEIKHCKKYGKVNRSGNKGWSRFT